MAKLGTQKRPAIVRVQTMERAQEIMALCSERGWIVVAGLEPDEPEDISDVEKLLGILTTRPDSDDELTPDMRQLISQATARTHIEPPPIGRNEPCPCGSGKKYKACCLRRAA